MFCELYFDLIIYIINMGSVKLALNPSIYLLITVIIFIINTYYK